MVARASCLGSSGSRRFAVFGIAISLAELDGGHTFDVEAQETELGLVIIDRRNQLCEGHADGVTSKPKASVAISIPV